MKNVKHLCLIAGLFAAGGVFGQSATHERYVKESQIPFYTAYEGWSPGTALFSDVAEDEEYFISRVKPKTRFTNDKTQVDPSMTSERKLLWWCPVGADGWNALPTYYFDSEVFSMWSYVDIYGNWTAPLIRMPGAFADICHKNGVKTSALASVPWAATITAGDGGHGSNINALNQGGSEKLLKFLRYYGIDGIGFNSEFNAPTLTPALKTLLSNSFKDKDKFNWPTFTNAWYSLMTNGGGVGGGDALSSANQDWFHYNGHPTSDAYFMNYNWGASGLATSENTANKFEGRSSFDVYGGMDFQGRSQADWIALKASKISVGLWGAHNMNMIFEARGELGSEATQKQKTYQLISENVFTGAAYNPVNSLPITNSLMHNSTNKTFHGFSKFITARSPLTTDNLAKEPFVTYFNLGNGKFFNVEGETTFNNQWYNIGMQDYLPTWRWWFTNKFMGRNATEDVPNSGLKAEFTWDDAWFGGSCLAISGQADLEYLQLFKTKYKLVSGDVLTIRYKVVSGSGAIAWASATEEKNYIEIGKVISSNLSAGENWIEKKVTIGKTPAQYNLADQTLALMGLKFTKTSNDFKILIGEIALTPQAASECPIQPTLVSSSLKTCNYKGIDFKLVFKMKDRAAGSAEPIYNSDVNTWYYKIYIQQENEDMTVCTATTSWAAYVVSAPYKIDGSHKVRIGVSAVSLDGKSESGIAWSEYQNIPAETVVEGIEIDKPVIKANETFKVSYIDPTHAPADKWEILNAQTGVVVKTVENTLSIETSLPDNGIYDLRMTYKNEGGKSISKLYQALIQISPEAVGAFPEIKTLKANNSSEAITVEKNAKVTYEYTGRPSDGNVSRGLRMSEVAFGIPAEQLAFDDKTSFSLSFWINPIVFNHSSDGTQLLNIRNASADYPRNEWGYIYSMITPENKLKFQIRWSEASGFGSGSETTIIAEDYIFEPGKWYHVAVVIGYNNGREVSLYVNGKLIKAQGGITDLFAWSQNNVIMIGGKAAFRSGFDGYLDEFQLYNKALTAEEVKKSMEHQTEIPESLIGYWDFETEADANNKIYSTGKQPYVAYMNELKTIDGNSQFAPVQMTFGTGAPFISGNVYKIETLPSWYVKNASISETGTGNDQSGKVGVTYAADGMYTATLTLSNGWGSTSKTFNYVKVEGGGTSISKDELNASYQAYPNPFENEVNVQFVNAGTYEVEIFDMTGRLVNAQQTTVGENDYTKISINGEAGVYFINIKQNGDILKALKVIKK